MPQQKWYLRVMKYNNYTSAYLQSLYWVFQKSLAIGYIEVIFFVFISGLT